MVQPKPPHVALRVALLLAAASIFSLLIGDGYRLMLARLVECGFGLLGERVNVASLTLLAPLDLGFFIALCIGLPAPSSRARWSAVAWGIPVVIILETALGMLLFYLASLTPRGSATTAIAIRITAGFAGSITWVLPAALWIALLGASKGRRAKV